MAFDFDDRKFSLKRKDTLLKNLKVEENVKTLLDLDYRKDAKLGTIMDREGVASQNQLVKKYKNKYGL